ncbi:hypothetical protein H5T53_02820 [Candidatus Bipolaricaulota bacterium]|nr:hypothetical protein [Candidatus Bipolaricaulota bacterium]
MSWRGRVEREYLEADREFVEEMLPVGSVDAGSFGLIADATRYLLVAEGDEVHIRPDIASLDEVLASLARGGSAVSRKDAEAAVAKFAELWEAKARARGKWDAAVAQAQRDGEVVTGLDRPGKRSFWNRLFGR